MTVECSTLRSLSGMVRVINKKWRLVKDESHSRILLPVRS